MHNFSLHLFFLCVPVKILSFVCPKSLLRLTHFHNWL
jgi:hypothetical protein